VSDKRADMRNDSSSKTSYHVRLKPDEKGIHLRLGELWQYRDLVRLLARKTFSLTYRQTVLGPLWILLTPLLSAVIYMFLFGYVASIGTDGVPQILFYFVSTALWEVFAQSLILNSGVFVSNANLFGKVYFPRLAVPISNMVVCLLKFGIQMIIIAVTAAVYIARGEVHPLWALCPILPLLVLQMAVLGLSVGILISSFTAKYRDLLAVVGVGVNLWMYASPVVYPLSAMPDNALKSIIKINPVTEIVELFRRILLGRGDFSPGFYLISLGITVLLFVCSAAVFNRVERTFADMV